MKLLVVFVHVEDAPDVAVALRSEGFGFTMLESTSGFLGQESRTFLVGLEKGRLDACLEVFSRTCTDRWASAESARADAERGEQDRSDATSPSQVEVGGAVAFVLEADRLL